MPHVIRLIAFTIIAMLKAKLTLVVFCLLLGASAWAQGLQDGEKRSIEVFTVTDIGPNLKPVGISASGQVAATGKCPTCGPYEHALLWSASAGLKDLVACRNESVTAEAARGVRVFPLNGTSIGRVGVDVATEFAS